MDGRGDISFDFVRGWDGRGTEVRAYPYLKRKKKGGEGKKKIQGESRNEPRKLYRDRVLDRDENPSNRRIIPLETGVETSHDAFILE